MVVLFNREMEIIRPTDSVAYKIKLNNRYK